MKFESGLAEGLLMTALCAITGALGFLTAQKVDKIKELEAK
jgi:hypothetical protein